MDSYSNIKRFSPESNDSYKANLASSVIPSPLFCFFLNQEKQDKKKVI